MLKEPHARRRRALLFLTFVLLLIQTSLPNLWMQYLGLVSHAEVTITFSPSGESLPVGGNTWVSIRVNNVTDLAGADIRLAFDASVIEIVDAVSEEGGVQVEPGYAPPPDFVHKNQADNGQGEIWYVVIRLPPTPTFSGNGTIARLHILGINDGTTSLRFLEHQLSTGEGHYIPHSASTCTIQVGNDTPTSTPTDTYIPSPTLTESPSSTPTETPTKTTTPTPSSTASPETTIPPTLPSTMTETPSPSPTCSKTPTATRTPTVTLRTFSGHVYEGAVGDRLHPLEGVAIRLYGSWKPGYRGTLLAVDFTNVQGHFAFSLESSYPHYSLTEENPPGYTSGGIVPGTEGIAATWDWVEFRDTVAGDYSGIEFYDTPLSGNTPAPSATWTATATTTTHTSVFLPIILKN